MDEVEFVDVQKICVLQCSALITTYIDMCIYMYIYFFFYTDIDTVCMHYIALHICGCLRKRAQNKTGFVLKPGFLYSRTAPTAFQTFKMSRNQSFSAVKSGGTRRRSAARHLHAWCLTDLKLWPPNSPTDKTSHQQKSKWISWICCENCCNHWIFLGINRRKHETWILIWNQHQN